MRTAKTRPRQQYVIMTLLAASLPILMLGQKNLVMNGGFENGDQIPSWHYREIYKENAIVALNKSQSYNGKYSLMASMPVAGKRAEFEQHIRLSSGSKPLHLKASIAAKVDSNSSAIALIYFYSHGKNVRTDYFKDGRFINNDWQKFENHIYLPANVDSVTINLRTYGPGTAWFDEVRIEQVNTNEKPGATVIKVVDDALQFAKNNY